MKLLMQIEMAEYTGYILPGQKQTHVKNTLFNSGVITLYISGSISIFDLLFRRLRLYIQSKKWETLTLSSEAETAFLRTPFSADVVSALYYSLP